MKIFLPCWGDKHIGLLKDCLGRTLRWPQNNAAIKGAEWLVTTDTNESLDRIGGIIHEIDPTATIISLIEDKVKYNADDVLLKSLKRAILLCLKDKSPLLMATPDYLYGEGSIEAIKKIGEGPGVCVSMAHMRCLPEALNHLNHPWTLNAEMIDIGMKHQHVTWSGSEESANPGRTFFGGISWKYIAPNILAVSHRLPAPFYANFLESDIAFFDKVYPPPYDQLTFALWDHLFPSELLQQGRLRYVGSSDAATMVEVTDADKNIPPINPYNVSNKDEYRGKNFQNHICKQVVTIFRREQS